MKKLICSGLLFFFAFGLWADSCPMCKTLPVHMIMAAKRHRDKAKQEDENGNKEAADAHRRCGALKERIASALGKDDEKELDKSAKEYKQAHEQKKQVSKDKTNTANDKANTVTEPQPLPCPKCTNGLE